MSAATRSASSSIRRRRPQATQLGGQGISVVSYSNNQDEALQYIKWFAGKDVQKKWWALGGYSCAKSVLNDPSFPRQRPVRRGVPESMGMVKDFWAEPSYAQLLQAEQKRVHDYVVADKGTAQEALDGLVKDWKASLQGRRQDVLRPTIRAWSAFVGAPGDGHAAPPASRGRKLTISVHQDASRRHE